MDRLKRFLAIPMAASAAAALWLLQRQAGSNALLVGVAATAALVLIFAAIGALQRRGDARAGLLTGTVLVVAIAAIAAAPRQATGGAHPIQGAEPWSEARVASALQQDHPAFVYFTADWCLTCKANEVAAIDRSEVRDAFKKAGVDVLAGDWTSGDPAITRFLESRGRAGVPLYLWYVPGKPPEELPQVLTPAILISRAQQPSR
jgi:thiol:disulfide interchange protein